MSKIKIQEIIERNLIEELKKSFPNEKKARKALFVFQDTDIVNGWNNAIREIVEAVVNKCADINNQNPNDQHSQSIIQVKQMIDYD